MTTIEMCPYEQLNKQILQIWRKPEYTDDVKSAPILYPTAQDYMENQINTTPKCLFIGMNPSFRENEMKKYVEEWIESLNRKGENYQEITKKWSPWKRIFEREYFNNAKDQEFEILEKIYKDFDPNSDQPRPPRGSSYQNNGKHNYFTKMLTISNECELDFNYIDIFPIRGTNQRDTLEKVKKKEELTPLAKVLVGIAWEFIETLEPSVVVVANAGVSNILTGFLKSNELLNGFDKDIGTYATTIKNKKRVPIFFSSMLKGGALDNGSYERLKWHIGLVLSDLPHKKCLQNL